ncbi:MAG: SEC-C metal-binding domain-containing protein [Bacteroidetes bacterium]|nr:SEC-C metal-binding domain-containing protein [Bacteroidota bacterium]
MKHTNYFNDFLNQKVNLNQSRLDTLDQRVQSVTTLLEQKLTGYRKFRPQGSYSHKTIIKPVATNDEFDADILIYIKDEDFDPFDFRTDYVREIYNVFNDHGKYRSIAHTGTRNVSIDYEGDFHIDIVPCIEYQDEFYVCNRVERTYEKTDGDGYRKWFIHKNIITSNNLLRKITRLIKFQRDHKSNYTIKSILLTTLLGSHVYDSDAESSEFRDVPQALMTMSSRINHFLQANLHMPTIYNPVLPEEDFNRNWNEVQYQNFRRKFDLYNSIIQKACRETDHNKSVQLWRRVFGDDFGKLHKRTASAPTIVYPPKLYSNRRIHSVPIIQYSHSQMIIVQNHFPGLYYDDRGVIRGQISFRAKYQLSGRKKRQEWIIVDCTSGDDCITGMYEIEIQLNQNPKVFEVGGRIENLAQMINRPIVDLHLFSDESCCLGLFLPNQQETLSDFVINKVYPYFVWQAYFEKFRMIPPCGEYSHGTQGVNEFLEDVNDIGRNDRCPCGSGRKFKACCSTNRS